MTDDERSRDDEAGQTTAPGSEDTEATMAEGDEAAQQDPTAEAPEKEMGDATKVPAAERTTAPQSPYSMRQVGIGIAVLAVGLVVAFLLPLLVA